MSTLPPPATGEHLAVQSGNQAVRVCVFMPRFHPLYGGHIVQMRRCLPRFAGRGVEPWVLTGSVKGSPKSESLDGVAIRRLAAPDGNVHVRYIVLALHVAWYLWRHRDRYDVLHVVGAGWPGFFALAAARLSGRGSLFEMVLLGSDDPGAIAKQPLGALRLRLWKLADRMASLSTALTETCLQAGVPPERIVVIPVGVDVDLFRPAEGPDAKQELRRRLDLPVEATVISFLGAVTRRKCVHRLVEALPEIARRHPDAFLQLIGPVDEQPGDRAYREQLEEQLRRDGLRDRVRFTGRVNDASSHLRAADVFVLPSDHEGLPNSVLEAMACGIPPVMTDIPGIARDIIRPPAEGRVVEDPTPRGFATAILDILEDPIRREAIGKAARTRIEEAFSIELRVTRYAKLYGELAGR